MNFFANHRPGGNIKTMTPNPITNVVSKPANRLRICQNSSYEKLGPYDSDDDCV
jgi:hypothetical protein